MGIELPIEWREVAQEILKDPGKVIFLGEADTGKTSLCLQLANLALQEGLRVGVFDLDIGQSHIGPPATIGIGPLENPIEDIGEINPFARYFVGALSPGSEPLRMIQGVERLLLRRPDLPSFDLLLIDTSGYVHGPQALSLQWKMFCVIQPDHYIFLERQVELEGLKRLSEREKGRKHRLQVPVEIRRKSPDARRSYRMEAWRRTFQHASTLQIPKNSSQLTMNRGTLVGLMGPGDSFLDLGLIEETKGEEVAVYTPYPRAGGIEEIILGRTNEPATALGWTSTMVK